MYWLSCQVGPHSIFCNLYDIRYKCTEIIAIVGFSRQPTDTDTAEERSIVSIVSIFLHIYAKSKISTLSDLAILESIIPNVSISIHSTT